MGIQSFFFWAKLPDKICLSFVYNVQFKERIFCMLWQICESLTSGPSHAVDITREVGIRSSFTFFISSN